MPSAKTQPAATAADSDGVRGQIVGQNLLLRHIADRIGLSDCLRAAFPDHWQLLLSCTFYISAPAGRWSISKAGARAIKLLP